MNSHLGSLGVLHARSVGFRKEGCFGGSGAKIVSHFRAIICSPSRHIKNVFKLPWKYSMES